MKTIQITLNIVRMITDEQYEELVDKDFDMQELILSRVIPETNAGNIVEINFIEVEDKETK